MRLGVKLLDVNGLNSFKELKYVTIHQEETTDLYFQLVDDVEGIRYVPASGATLLVEIARYPEPFGTISNQREVLDRSIRRYATEAFPSDDRSLWTIPLTTTDTEFMMSSNIRFTLTEGSTISKALVSQAIVVIPKEGGNV